MNKNQTLTALTLSTALLALPVWAGQGGPNPNAGFGGAQLQQDCSYSGITLAPTISDDLIYMVEEEKLAGDLYWTFYSENNYPSLVFSNIADSEDSHVAAIQCLMQRYGIDDPTVGQDVGSFVNTGLQDLYDDLLSSGFDEIEALKVGALVEETDIADLIAAIGDLDAALNPDIVQVYNNLMRGSRNHLRSFVQVLGSYGVTYAPQVLIDADYPGLYVDIINGEMERGNGQGQGGPAAGAGNGNAGGRGRGF